jgi:hypothetical protein
MESWFVPPKMKQLAGTEVINYGYDKQNTVRYSFNSLGFRSPEPVTTPSLVVVGNSISFGIGLDMSMTYGAILSSKFNRSLDNRAFGCYFHENHDHLSNIDLLTQQDRDSIFVIQINNLDRRRQGENVLNGNDANWCVKRFLDFFDQAEHLLKHRPHKYIYWDDVNYSIPDSVKKLIFIKNQFQIDNSIANNHGSVGPKSHFAIAKALSYVI